MLVSRELVADDDDVNLLADLPLSSVLTFDVDVGGNA